MVSIIKSKVLRAKTRVCGSTLFSADTNRNIREMIVDTMKVLFV